MKPVVIILLVLSNIICRFIGVCTGKAIIL